MPTRTTIRRAVIFACGLAIASAPARADWPALPPLTGEFAGRVKATALPGSPEWTWKLGVSATEGGRRRADIAADAAGAKVRATAEVDPKTGAGTWSLEEAVFNAAVWVAAQPVKGLDGVTATGTIRVTGGGTLRAGRPVGTIRVEWPDGSVRNEAAGWALEGVTLAGEFAVDAAAGRVASVAPLAAGVRTIVTRRFGARNFTLSGTLRDDRTLAVESARIEIAGGEASLVPCVVPLAPPVLKVRVRIDNVGLQDLVALVPAGLAEARGRIGGELGLSWSEAEGFQIGIGRLELARTEPTVVRLAPSVGMITSHLPRSFVLVPAWLGPISRWLTAENPSYGEMQQIELGQAELRVESLEVQVSPEGDERGRSASVRLRARPERADSAVKELTFDVNVLGPLNAVLKLGMDDKTSFGAK